ncbi:MAG TPA: hypothetical protein ENH52_01605 [Nitrospirae bacterium]|nr:hypothetical protein [Nitrospirota bacterium]
MTTSLQGLPDIRELKREAIEVIIKSFGITKAAFFLREMMSQKMEYFEIKDKLFEEKTAKELYNEICEWKKK